MAARRRISKVASLLGQYGYLPVGVIAYARAVAGTGLSIGSVWWYATYHHRLVDPDLDAGFIRARNLVAVIVPLIFLASLPFTLISPLIAMASWWTAPFVSILALRVLERHSVTRP